MNISDTAIWWYQSYLNLYGDLKNCDYDKYMSDFKLYISGPVLSLESIAKICIKEHKFDNMLGMGQCTGSQPG